jgi:type IV pilus assembly protein PilE
MNHSTFLCFGEPQRVRGFSLIELLVAIVIATTLVAIAVPSYNNFVREGRRTEAKTAVLDMASLEERYFNTQNQYSSSPQDLGYTGATFPVPGIPLASGNYTITVANVTPATPPSTLVPGGGTPASFLITATVAAGTDQANDLLCQSFSVDSQGRQTATGSDPNPNVDCWK